MTLILELPHDLEQRLSSEAARAGLPLEKYALQLLSGASDVRPTNDAELVAYWRWEGVIGSRSDIQDSQFHARELRRAELRSGE